MLLLPDFQGRDIRLTDERLTHILEHTEMAGQEGRIAETLLTPQSVIVSHHDTRVHLYHKLFESTPVTRKYMGVMVKSLVDDTFVITTFFTNKEKKGVRIWPR
jgi:hypothetical protein